ncbi:MAG TPA: hypothetical protein VF269_06175 [Rhodanobacteraceae bacterium]
MRERLNKARGQGVLALFADLLGLATECLRVTGVARDHVQVEMHQMLITGGAIVLPQSDAFGLKCHLLRPRHACGHGQHRAGKPGRHVENVRHVLARHHQYMAVDQWKRIDRHHDIGHRDDHATLYLAAHEAAGPARIPETHQSPSTDTFVANHQIPAIDSQRTGKIPQLADNRSSRLPKSV